MEEGAVMSANLSERMKSADSFRGHVDDALDMIMEQSGGAIEQAAQALADCIQRDAIIHIAAAGGHSQIPAMEFFYRAGGLANVDIIFSPGLGLFDGKPCLERVPGMGRVAMGYHDVRPEDVVIVCNYYGMNAATIDLALSAKERACTTIGISSKEFSRNTPENFVARHPTKKNLADIVDIAIDTFTSRDEQLIPIDGQKQKVGVVSSLASCFIMQLLNIRTCEICSERGIVAPVFQCANIPGGDEVNDALIRKYIPRCRHLYPETSDFRGL